MNSWKYRYRRLRVLSLDDLTRRLGIYLWRKNLIKFVKNKSTPVTSKNIREWLSIRNPSIDGMSLDPEQINSNLLKSILPGFLTDNEFWKTFGKLYPAEKEKLINYSQDVIRGQIELYGWKPVSVSIPTLELHDSEASQMVKDWNSRYYWDINFYHSHDHPAFDVKWLWELQRLQFLVWLGAAWKLTGDNKFAACAKEIIWSWIQALRYPFGVQWSSNLEVGLRLLSISRCHIMCMDSPSWNRDFIALLAPWEYLHAAHLRNELTLHHTLGNHPLGEACSLLWFSLVSPHSQETLAWEKHSSRTVNDLITKLIFCDGVYREQSMSYLKFVLEFILPLIVLGNSRANAFSCSTRERIESCLLFIQAVSYNGKETPMIGDSDSGSATGWRLSEFWDFSWLLATGSILLNSSRLAIGMEKLPAEAFLNVGLEGLKKFNSGPLKHSARLQKSKKKPFTHVDFPVGGYHVASDPYFRLIFDSGPLGIYPGFGHGHADALSILLAVKGRPVIVDSGTMHYNADPKLRSHFRQTQSHNALVVNGKSQAEILDTFRWTDSYRIQWNDTIVRRDYGIMSGLLITNLFVHKRTIIHFNQRGFIIKDQVQTEGSLAIEGLLHFAPHIAVQDLGKGKFAVSTGDEELEIAFHELSLISSQIVMGLVKPMRGWYSRYYGEMVPTSCLRFFHQGTNHCELMTTISRPGIALEWPEEFSAF